MTHPQPAEIPRPKSIERKPFKKPNEFEEEAALEDFLKTVKHRALEVKRTRFTDDEVGAKAKVYTDLLNDELLSNPRLYDIPVRMSGDGIQEPNSDIKIGKLSERSKAIMVQFDTEEGYRPVSHFEYRTGRIESIYAQPFAFIGEDNQPTGENTLQIRYVVRTDTPQERHVMHDTQYFDAVHVLAWPAFIADADTVTIESSLLHKERENVLMQHQLAEMGFAGEIFRRNLAKLAYEFQGVKSHEFTQLEGLKRLQSLGNLAGTLAKRGPDQAEVVKRAILEVLSLGKNLVIAGTSYMPMAGQDKPVALIGQVNGQIWGLQLPESETDPTIPALILEEKGSPDKTPLYVFEFSEIQGVKF